jgi:hypothetical protein
MVSTFGAESTPTPLRNVRLSEPERCTTITMGTFVATMMKAATTPPTAKNSDCVTGVDMFGLRLFKPSPRFPEGNGLWERAAECVSALHRRFAAGACTKAKEALTFLQEKRMALDAANKDNGFASEEALERFVDELQRGCIPRTTADVMVRMAMDVGVQKRAHRRLTFGRK